MNHKQRIAVIILVIAIVLSITSLFVRAAMNNATEDLSSKNETGATAEVRLTVLPHGGLEDKGVLEDGFER